ncbi:MAG: hypothetical protein FWE57_08455 [Chitinispirillia bacterium]|nr:hypothetical protein [Chitinispirillia bacterium]
MQLAVVARFAAAKSVVAALLVAVELAPMVEPVVMIMALTADEPVVAEPAVSCFGFESVPRKTSFLTTESSRKTPTRSLCFALFSRPTAH